MYTDPAQASRELGDMMNLIDNDTIAMWTNAPMGLECVVSFCEVFSGSWRMLMLLFGRVDEWGNYFSNFSEITQGQQVNGH
jgi:hypothetical protein